MGYKKQVPMNSLALLCVAVVVSSMQEELLLGVNADVDDHKPLAMYVFGDSTLDVGNNNYLPGKEVFRAIRPCNGIDFPGFPTGRYSNGYNTADYVGTCVDNFVLRSLLLRLEMMNVRSLFLIINKVKPMKSSIYVCPCCVQQRAWGSRIALCHICRCWSRRTRASRMMIWRSSLCARV